MDILKAFSLLDESYTINIQGTLEKPLFQANQIGKLLGIAKIRTSIDDFDEDEKVAHTTATLGGDQEMLFLTEIGLYKLLGRSRKPIAKTFQKWMITTLRDLRQTGTYTLQKTNEVERHFFEHKGDIKVHSSYLNMFDKKNVVYICKLKKVNETQYVIKVGCTQNIKDRMTNIGLTYNSCEPILIDVYECDYQYKLEKFIHNHTFMSSRKHELTIKNGERSKETYLVTDADFEELQSIIKLNKFQFMNTKIEIEHARIQAETLVGQNMVGSQSIVNDQKEIAKMELDKRMVELEIMRLQTQSSIALTNSVISDESTIAQLNADISVAHFTIRERLPNSRAPKVYQYSPDNLTTHVCVHNTLSELERKDSNISVSGLKRAVQGNHIYKDFRWIFVKQDEEPPAEIPPTISNKAASTEVKFIAMINPQKTAIVKVFPTQKDAAEYCNFSTTGFTRAIKQGSISANHYWNYFDECDESLRTDFLANNKLPDKHVFTKGTQIKQIDPRTGIVLKVHASKRDVVKQFQMSQTTLTKNIADGTIYNGYIWK